MTLWWFRPYPFTLPRFVHPRRRPLGLATYLRQDESLLIFVTSLLASPSVLCGGCSERTFTAFRFITNAHAMFNRKYSEYKGINCWIAFATFCGGLCPYSFTLSRFVNPCRRPLRRATYPRHDESLLKFCTSLLASPCGGCSERTFTPFPFITNARAMIQRQMMDHALWFERWMRTALAIFTGGLSTGTHL